MAGYRAELPDVLAAVGAGVAPVLRERASRQRLAAELADHWNGGIPSLDEVPGMIEEMDEVCRAVGRDPATLTCSAEVLVRTVPTPPDVVPEEQEIRGEPEAVAARLQAFADLGLDHLQVQLRPNSIEGVAAFAPVVERLCGSALRPRCCRGGGRRPAAPPSS